jgi:CPA2 family monovalent cation:H+ antiporter-2
MNELLLHDIVIICALALAVTLACHRFAIPAVVGFLITGIISGPHGLQLIRQVEEVEHIAEIGVVCLLFTIGVEFSLKTLLKIRFMSLFGGGLQVALTLAGGTGLGILLGQKPNEAVFFGFLVALSSTAIVLKILQDNLQTESPHGRLIVAILIFQDIIVVPMMLVAPFLAGEQSSILIELMLLLAKSLAIVVIVILGTRWIVPALLHRVAVLRGRELFLIAVVLLGLGVAWFTLALGLSLALGAFIAGLIVSESEFSETVLGNIIPFRDLFTSLFFVSVGMLLDVKYVATNLAYLSVVTIAVILLKFIMASSAAFFLRLPVRTAVLSGLALSQIGEFSFVLSEPGIKLGIMTPDCYQLFLGVSVITMIITPFLIAWSPLISQKMLRLPFPESWKTGLRNQNLSEDLEEQANHLIIVGYGTNGRHLSKSAAAAAIPRVIIELNPETVRRERDRGEPIFFGDASQETVLSHAGIMSCAVLVIVISDPAATKRIIDTARRINPSVYIICRTRFITEMEPLYELGADDVIPEDYEASIEILTRVLTKYLVPRKDIDELVDRIRDDHYRMLRKLVYPESQVCDISLQSSDTNIRSVRVAKGSPVVGKSISDLAFRKEHGVTVIGIKRGESFTANPSPLERIEEGDIVVILGDTQSMEKVERLLETT